MEKKSVSLQRYLTTRLLLLGVTLLASMGAIWALLIIAQGTNFIAYANAGETQSKQAIKQMQLEGSFSPELLPTHSNYALYNADGSLVSSSFSPEELARKEIMWVMSPGDYTTYTVTTYPNGETSVVAWDYVVRFTSPALDKLFPSAGYLFVILLVLAIFLNLFMFIRLIAKRIKKPLDAMQTISQKVAHQELDFLTPPASGLREMDATIQSMDKMRLALKDALTEQWQMEIQRQNEIAALSHDLKTPLSVISGNAELLLEEHLSPEQQSSAQAILDSTTRAQSYLSILADASQSTGQQIIAKEKIQVGSFLADLVNALSVLGVPQNISFSVSVDNDLSVTADKNLLTRALQNICENALRYATHGSTISIAAEKSDKHILFKVQNDGDGFSPNALAHATELFWQEEKSRTSNTHYGIGLAMAANTAIAHGGKLQLSNTDTGALVTLSIFEDD